MRFLNAKINITINPHGPGFPIFHRVSFFFSIYRDNVAMSQ